MAPLQFKLEDLQLCAEKVKDIVDSPQRESFNLEDLHGMEDLHRDLHRMEDLHRVESPTAIDGPPSVHSPSGDSDSPEELSEPWSIIGCNNSSVDSG